MKSTRRVCLATLVIIMLIYLVVFLYDDIVVTYTHSIHFLECLFSGKFFDFYRYTLERKISGYAADYYLPIYILFGFWNLPMWLFSKIIGIPMRAMSLLWCKMILIPFYVGCIYVAKKILEYFEKDSSNLLICNIFSSICLVIPVFATGQYDVISLFLVLLGTWISFKEDRITKLVVAIFALAIPFKLFAVFSYVFLVLLKEKNIWKIIFKTILGFSGIVAFSIPFCNQPEYYSALSTNSGWVHKMAVSVVEGGVENISIFFLCFFVLCYIAYNTYTEDRSDYIKWAIWLNSAFWACFFVFVDAHPYWSVFLSLFIGINVCLQKNNKNMCLLLNIVSNICLFVVQGYRFHWVYFCDTANLLLLKNVDWEKNLYGIESLADIINKMEMQDYVRIVYTLFVFAIFALIYATCPAKKVSNEKEEVFINIENAYVINIVFLIFYLVVTLLIIYVV